VEGLIHFVTGIKAALELGLQDAGHEGVADARRAMRGAFDAALKGLQEELLQVGVCACAWGTAPGR